MRGAVWLMVLLIGSTASQIQAGKIYKWTDPDGRVHFGDQPTVSDAEELKIQSHLGPAEVSRDGEDFGAPEVKVLSTRWCGVCRRAKAWLTARGISFTEYDVETSDIGRQEYRRLQGHGVPIILVGRQRMDGFSAEKLERMLKNVGYP